MFQSSFESAWGNLSFSQSDLIKITQVQGHLSWFIISDFLDYVLYPLEEASGKVACQRN